MTVPAARVRYRARIHDGDPATIADFEAGIGGNLLSVTSLRRDSNPSGGGYIAEEPDISPSEVDLVTGKASVGTATVRIIDANTGDDSGLVAADYFDEVHPPFNVPGYVYASNWTPVGSGGVRFGNSGTPTEDGTSGAQIAVNALEVDGSRGMDQHTFTGLTPGQTYRVRCRIVCNYNGNYATSQVGLVAQRGTGLEVSGLITLDNSGVLPWQTISIDVEADGSGEIVIDWGWDVIHVLGFVIQGYLYIDNLEIWTIAAIPPGRVVTRVLADANARQQLLSLRAVLEQCDESDCTYDGTMKTWTFADVSAPSYRQLVSGYANDLDLINALDFDLKIGETRREEQRIKPWLSVTPADGATCIIGGPVVGGFGKNPDGSDLVPDFGDTEWTIHRVDDADATTPAGANNLDSAGNRRKIVVLQFVSGAMRPSYAPFDPSNLIELAKVVPEVNYYASKFFVDDPATWFITGQTAEHFGSFPGLVVAAQPVSSGSPFNATPLSRPAAVSGWKKYGARHDLLLDPLHNVLMYLDWNVADITDDRTPSGKVIIPGKGAPPSLGDPYTLVVYPTKIGVNNPVHLRGHPVDLHTAFFTKYGIPFDSASAAALKTAIGPLWVELRYTQSMTLAEWSAPLMAFFGYSTRVGDNAERVFYPLRVRPLAPAYAITMADRRSKDTVLWRNSESSVITGVDLTTKTWRPYDATVDKGNREPDDLVIGESPIEGDRVDESTFGDRRIQLTVPGTVHVDDGAGNYVPLDCRAQLKQIGGVILDRWGRGAPEGEIDVFPSVTVEEGDEATIDVPDMPVSQIGATPVTQRGLAPLTVQIMSKKPSASGFRLRFLVAGSLSQGSPTGPGVPPDPGTTDPVPVFTITPDWIILGGIRYGNGFVTVLNSDEIGPIGWNVYFEYVVGTSMPGVGVSGTAFGPLLTPTPGADFISTPPVLPGETVWVRARSGDPSGTHFSAWTLWDSATTVPTTGGIGAGAPAAPNVNTVTNTTSGVVDATANADAKTVGVKMASGPNDGSGDPPTLATIRGTSLLTTPPYLVSGIATLASVAGLVTIGAVAYDVNGNESPMGTRTATRGVIFQKDIVDLFGTPSPGEIWVFDPDAGGTGIPGYIPGTAGAPTTAEYLLGTPDGALPNARIPTDTATIEWDLTTAGQAKAQVVAGSIGPTQLAATAVTPGSYTNLDATIDADGRITAAANGTPGGGAGTIAVIIGRGAPEAIPTTPTSSGLLHSFYADVGVTQSSGRVSNWANQGSSALGGKDGVQASGGVQPLIVADPWGVGLPAIYFDSARGDYLAWDFSDIASIAWSWMAIVSRHAAKSGNMIFGATSGATLTGHQIGWITDQQFIFEFYNFGVWSANTLPVTMIDQPMVVMGVCRASSPAGMKTRSLGETLAYSGGGFTPSGAPGGGGNIGRAVAQYFNGHIAELHVWDHTLTYAEQAANEAYAVGRYPTIRGLMAVTDAF